MYRKSVPDFDEITVRELVSNIKVLDKQHLLVRFKDGVEIEQLLPEGKKLAPLRAVRVGTSN